MTKSSNHGFSERACRTEEPPISWLLKKPLENPEIISLAVGFVDQESLPRKEIIKLLDEILREPNVGLQALQYGKTGGLLDLQSKTLELFLEGNSDAGRPICRLTPEDVVITNGSQQMLYLVTNALVDPGDIVLVEDPTYFIYMGVLNEAGAQPVGVAVDENGMIPESLEEKLKFLEKKGLADRVKLIYLMVYYANPTGISLSPDRRGELLDVLDRFESKHHPIYMIEDIAYRDLRIDGPLYRPVKEIEPENRRVVTIGTFSKAFSPGLRLGYGILPPEIRVPVLRFKGNQDFGSTNLNQHLMAHAVDRGVYGNHVAVLRETYRKKRDLFLDALSEFFPADAEYNRPTGGFYVWVRLPGIDTGIDAPLFREALRQNVLYVPGEYCYCRESGVVKDCCCMRLCYGLPNVETLREGARRLGDAVKTVCG